MERSRTIRGCDVYAILVRFAPGEADLAAARRLIDPGAEFTSFEDLIRVCPPERIGLGFGRLAALAGPLFGEFE